MNKDRKKEVAKQNIEILTWKAAAPDEQVQTHVLCSTIEGAPTDWPQTDYT